MRPTHDAERRRARRLSLGDPLDERAAGDRPEVWGEREESEPERAARYESERPPHHGD